MIRSHELLIFYLLAIAGCASNSGVVPIGTDTYMISRTASTGFTMPTTIKAEALIDANKYCVENHGKASLIKSELFDAIPLGQPGGPRWPSAEIEFTCSTVGATEGNATEQQSLDKKLDVSKPKLGTNSLVAEFNENVSKSSSQVNGKEARTALLIGNSNYPQSPLKTPIEDIRSLRAVLNSLGFDVISVENASRKEFVVAIEKFTQKIQTKGGVGLVFYAGHGMQIKGKNFLIPVDATIQTEISGTTEAVDVDLLVESMAQSTTRVNVIILDAYRNNPFERRFRGPGRGLAPMNAGDARGTLIPYSTAPGKTASDGEGQHSPYAEALSQVLKHPGLTIEQVFKHVRQQVENETDGAQTPWETSSLTGELIL